jgi:hypothetical protein
MYPKRRQHYAHDRVARTSRGMLWVTFLIFIANVTYAWVSYQQWGAIDDASRLNKAIFVVGQRPWVAIAEAMPTGITYDVNGLNLGIAFSLENAGNNPALHGETQTR